eukprot:403651_1
MPAVPAPERKVKSKRTAREKTTALVLTEAQRKERRRKMKKEIIARAVKYRRAYQADLSREKHMALTAKDWGNYYVHPDAKVAFVMRIRGINDMPPKEKKILQLLRLRQIFNGVFVKLNKATLQMLLRVNTYIAWGFPSRETISKLVYKRGYGKINKQRVKLVDNSVVQQGLEKHGIICVEDIVHQLWSAGERFREVNTFLWPFKMSAPKKGLNAKRKHFVEGGDHGNREEYINE